MGRFAHLLHNNVFAEAFSAPLVLHDPLAVHGVRHVYTSSPVHCVPGYSPSPVRGCANEKERSVPPLLQTSLATQHLFLQVEGPLVDLQIIDDDDDVSNEDECKAAEHPEEKMSKLSINRIIDSDIEAQVILQGCGQQDDAIMPFELGVGQIQSVYTVERFVHAGDDEHSSDDSSVDTDDSDDGTSVASSTIEHELEWAATLDLEAHALPKITRTPRVVPTSPAKKWVQPKNGHVPVPVLNISTVSCHVDASLETPGRKLTLDIERELAFIKLGKQETMAKSERLLTQKDVIQKTTVPKSTRSAPSLNIHPSAPPQGTVGLRLWPNRNMEFVIAGIENGSQADSSGIILGDALLEVDGQNVEGLHLLNVVNKLSGPTGSKVSVRVSRIYDNFRTNHNFFLVRDVSVQDEPVVQAQSRGAISQTEMGFVDSPTTDPIIMALQCSKTIRSMANATNSTDLVTAGDSHARLSTSECQQCAPDTLAAAPFTQTFCPDVDYMQSPAFDEQMHACEKSTPQMVLSPLTNPFEVDSRPRPSLSPQWDGGQRRVMFLKSPRGNNTLRTTMSLSPSQEATRISTPSSLLSPRHLSKLRRPLGLIQDASHLMDVSVKYSPVANLQAFSPNVDANQRANLCNTSLSPQTAERMMITPRKGLVASRPSGAKPRRFKGELATHTENQFCSNLQSSAISVKILKPVPHNDLVPETSILLSANTNRPPLLCVRSVSTMAQPHIVDHTRLHLDVFAEIQTVVPYPKHQTKATVAVQCSDHHSDAGDVVLNYNEQVVSDLKVFSGGEQISGVDARKLVFGYNTDWSASAFNFVDISPFAQLIEQEVPAPPTKIGSESGGNWKYPFPIPKNHASQSNTSLPPHYQMHETPHAVLKGGVSPWKIEKQRRRRMSSTSMRFSAAPSLYEDETVAELINSTIAELEVGC